jgi:hypothetical protein
MRDTASLLAADALNIVRFAAMKRVQGFENDEAFWRKFIEHGTARSALLTELTRHHTEEMLSDATMLESFSARENQHPAMPVGSRVIVLIHSIELGMSPHRWAEATR